MLQKNQQAVVGAVFLNIILTAGTTITTTSKDVTAIKTIPKTTASSLLPLQPLLNVTSSTAAEYFGPQKSDTSHVKASPAVKNDSVNYESKEDAGKALNGNSITAPRYKHPLTKADMNIQYVYNNDDRQFYVTGSFGNATQLSSTVRTLTPEFNSTITTESAIYKIYKNKKADKGENSEDRKKSRAETVNEVLLNLFPNGFSDIFRFSYAEESYTTQKPRSDRKLQQKSLTKAPIKELIEVKPKTEQKIKPQDFQMSKKAATEISKELKNLTNDQNLDIKKGQDKKQKSHSFDSKINQVLPTQSSSSFQSRIQNKTISPAQNLQSSTLTPISTHPTSKRHLFSHLSTGAFSLGEKKRILEHVTPKIYSASNSKTLNNTLQNIRLLKNPQDSFRKQRIHAKTTSLANATQPVETQLVTSDPHAFLPQHIQQQKQDLPPNNKTFYSFESSITKEYRRELEPGHTEIVVEKLHYPRDHSNVFQDGQNTITKEVLLRINRAAEDASVLPSLLLEPAKDNSTETLLSMNGPIVILKDNSDEFEDSNYQSREEDNLIAESQDSRQQIFQSLPDDFKVYSSFKTIQHENNMKVTPYDNALQKFNESKQITVNQPFLTYINQNAESSQLLSLKSNNESSQKARISHELDKFQENAEKNFHLKNLHQEAPSRKFLKHFDPSLSEVVNRPILKGSFHYEATLPNPITAAVIGSQNAAGQNDPEQQASGNFAKVYLQPAAQLQYREEQRKQEAPSRLHTQAQHSKPVTYGNSYQFLQHQQQFHEQKHREEIQKDKQGEQQQLFYREELQPQYAQSQQVPFHQQQQQQHQPQEQQQQDEVQLQLQRFHQYQQQQQQHNQETQHQYQQNVTPAPTNILYITVKTPTAYEPQSQHQSHQNPHEFVSEAAASLRQSPNISKLTHPQSYTLVEVQKSINIHNKLIKEQDGKLLEHQETTYYQPQYVSNISGKLTEPQNEFQDNNYVSLATHPIRVQHADELDEQNEEAVAASHTDPHHVSIPDSMQQDLHYDEKIVQNPLPYPPNVDQVVKLPIEEPQEKKIERPYTVQIVEKHVPEPYPIREVEEKIVQRPVEVEKIVERPVNVPYPVPVDHYIDRPYPVQEIVEKHIPVPYPVIEQVGVPVHVEHFIDRPYPIETIVEKSVHVPYPVEKIVEKIVEKHVPVEVERIVEKPVEKIIQKLVDRPVPIPIHVPVGIPMPMHGHYAGHQHLQTHPPQGLHEPYPPIPIPYPLPTGQAYQHPNSVGWSGPPTPSVLNLPEKVLQNYYARMLKKLLPQYTNKHKSVASTAASNLIAAKPTSRSVTKAKLKSPLETSPQNPFKILDMLFDLKPPPPPPPSGASWSQGARYVYNTLPKDLTSTTGTDASLTQHPNPYTSYKSQDDEFQRWRNGHSLKRSPNFGRNLHVEYGFKPPIVPSVEIDEKGVPLQSVSAQ